MPSSRESSAQLADIVRRFRVCWEVSPEYVFIGNIRRQVGFNLELLGTHEPGVDRPMPGCPECVKVYQGLSRIAAYILPREDRPSIYEVGSFDHAIRYSPIRKDRADISLMVTILHKGDLDEPVQKCQERCLIDMKERLAGLGACEGHWSSRADRPS